MDTKNIICVMGNNTTDLAFFTQKSLQPGEKVGASRFEEFAGGQAANVAFTLASLGLPIRYIGTFGDDYYAKLSRESLENIGIDIQFCPIIMHCRNAVANVIVGEKDGERTSALFRDSRLEELNIEDDMLNQCSMIYTDGHLTRAAIDLASKAKAKGIPIITDAECINPDMLRLISVSSVMIAPRAVIEIIAGKTENLREALMDVCKHGPSLVVATMGHRGSAAFGNEVGYIEMPAIPCVPIDTTGAGDAFHAGFTFATYKGKNTKVGLEFASHVAAATCECAGPRPSQEHLSKLRGHKLVSE